jgi:hypothetical protein
MLDAYVVARGSVLQSDGGFAPDAVVLLELLQAASPTTSTTP